MCEARRRLGRGGWVGFVRFGLRWDKGLGWVGRKGGGEAKASGGTHERNVVLPQLGSPRRSILTVGRSPSSIEDCS